VPKAVAVRMWIDRADEPEAPKLSEEQLEAARDWADMSAPRGEQTIVCVKDLVAEIERLRGELDLVRDTSRTCKEVNDKLHARIAELESIQESDGEVRRGLDARLAEVDAKLRYYESVLTIDDGQLFALEGGAVAKPVRTERVVELADKLARAEAEVERLEAIVIEQADERVMDRERLASAKAEAAGLRYVLGAVGQRIMNYIPVHAAEPWVDPLVGKHWLTAWKQERDRVTAALASFTGPDALAAVREAQEALDLTQGTDGFLREFEGAIIDKIDSAKSALARVFGSPDDGGDQ
jgi:DNA repair exonuclease SbcCD ATPase subunit